MDNNTQITLNATAARYFLVFESALQKGADKALVNAPNLGDFYGALSTLLNTRAKAHGRERVTLTRSSQPGKESVEYLRIW